MNLPKLRPVITGILLSVLFSSCAHRVPKPPVVSQMPVILPEEEPAIPPIPQNEPSSEIRTRVRRPPEAKVRVKIGIRQDAEVVTIACDGGLSVFSADSGQTQRFSAGKHTLRVINDRITIDAKPFKGGLAIRSGSSAEFLESNEKKYRGEFLVRRVADKITLINQLSVDDYLRGVLPREVVVTWPLESLKVQAVASRTYLASHMGRHGSQGFDLCSDVHCQVYGGMTKEHPSCNQAVEDTRGEILMYEGKPIAAYFHSNCGGRTEEVEHVWGLNHAVYLPCKSCSYGTKDPRYNWSFTYSDEVMLKLLKSKTEVKGSEFKNIRILKKSQSGRAERVAVRTDEGTYEMSANQFRVALDPEKIRSTLWNLVRRTGHGYEFHGKGWGHGVGMCQWGAKGQAEAGRGYEQILSFYYPHSTLKTWSHR